MTDTLFDLDSVKQDSPRLQQIKRFEIQTHHTKYLTEEQLPWVAVPMKVARQVVDEYDSTKSSVNSIEEICASYSLLLEDYGLIFYGTSEREVQDAALNFCLRKEAQVKP